MEKQFLDETGLQTVADNVNTRLKAVTSMPENPHNNQIVLYIGESGMVYTKGCIYKYNGNTWTDITPSLIVEQNYNPESINAQSGTAVAQAQNVLINKLFTSNTWSTKTWNGYTTIYGVGIWTDGNNIYYSNGSGEQYVLNKSTDTWESKTWVGVTSLFGTNIWSDGTDIYYSNSSTQKILNKTTGEWEDKTWNGSLRPNLGMNVWSDGTNIYYSKDTTQYVLNKETDTWSTKTWGNYNNFSGENIWTDGTDIYYSNSTYGQYKLNKATDTWEDTYWGTIYIGRDIWTDGINIYYSSGSNQMIFNRATLSWKVITWNGLSQFEGKSVWSDGEHTYYSNDTNQYILTSEINTYIN